MSSEKSPALVKSLGLVVDVVYDGKEELKDHVRAAYKLFTKCEKKHKLGVGPGTILECLAGMIRKVTICYTDNLPHYADKKCTLPKGGADYLAKKGPAGFCCPPHGAASEYRCIVLIKTFDFMNPETERFLLDVNLPDHIAMGESLFHELLHVWFVNVDEKVRQKLQLKTNTGHYERGCEPGAGADRFFCDQVSQFLQVLKKNYTPAK